jgi:putative restriction endonuclease
MRDSGHLLDRIGNLRVDRATGDPAPHKPLLLLVFLDMAERGDLTPIQPLTAELSFQFLAYWTIVAYRRSLKPDVRLPFCHLSNDGVLVSLDESRQPSLDRKRVRFVQFSGDFLRLAYDPALRQKARRVLVSHYFRPAEQIALYEMLGMKGSSREAEVGASESEDTSRAQKVGREARFRLHVMAEYGYTCALTGYRLTTIPAGSIVDAAHIHPFSDSRNNDVRNGFALCKNAHWMFDQGLWTVDDDYHVVVALGAFEEYPDNSEYSLTKMHGRRLSLPRNPASIPSPIHFAWHRKRRFLGGM